MGNQSSSKVFFLLPRAVFYANKLVILMMHLQSHSFGLPLGKTPLTAELQLCVASLMLHVRAELGDQASVRTEQGKGNKHPPATPRTERGVGFLL